MPSHRPRRTVHRAPSIDVDEQDRYNEDGEEGTTLDSLSSAIGDELGEMDETSSVEEEHSEVNTDVLRSEVNERVREKGWATYYLLAGRQDSQQEAHRKACSFVKSSIRSFVRISSLPPHQVRS